MTPEEFRKAGHELIDLIADYRTRVSSLPVLSKVAPGEIKASLPEAAPEQPESMDAILADVDRIVMPGLTHFQHPKFFGYFPANVSLASVLGDLLSTGLGQLGLAWQTSPALTELEDVMTAWMARLLGLSPAWSGVIQDTASTSTLVALICARERATAHSASRAGLQAEASPLIVYTSAQAHSSVDKAALLAGFGRDNIRHIAHDAAFALDADALEKAIIEDVAAGRKPCAIVATVGTTATTAFDPVKRCAEIAARHGLWLHVDAAMAGSAMILPDCRHLWAGVEGADSLVVNAHKWLGVAFDCSLYFVRDADGLVRVMSTNPSYLRTSADEKARNLRDWGIPLGRRFRALKLWFTLREQGAERLRARLRRDIDNARWLEVEIRKTPDWKILAPVQLQTIVVRHEPESLSGEELDLHTTTWVDELNRSGKALLTPAIIDGRWAVRISIGALDTTRDDAAALWNDLQDVVSRKP